MCLHFTSATSRRQRHAFHCLNSMNVTRKQTHDFPLRREQLRIQRRTMASDEGEGAVTLSFLTRCSPLQHTSLAHRPPRANQVVVVPSLDRSHHSCRKLIEREGKESRNRWPRGAQLLFRVRLDKLVAEIRWDSDLTNSEAQPASQLSTKKCKIDNISFFRKFSLLVLFLYTACLRA